MSQYKQIAFLQAGEPVIQIVDFERLSPQARELADAVSSTICYDESSTMYVASNQTNEQYWLDIAEHGDSHGIFSTGFARYMVSEYQAGRCRDKRNAHPTQMYLWDGLRLTETPEQYFERHAAFILEHKWIIAATKA